MPGAPGQLVAAAAASQPPRLPSGGLPTCQEQGHRRGLGGERLLGPPGLPMADGWARGALLTSWGLRGNQPAASGHSRSGGAQPGLRLLWSGAAGQGGAHLGSRLSTTPTTTPTPVGTSTSPTHLAATPIPVELLLQQVQAALQLTAVAPPPGAAPQGDVEGHVGRNGAVGQLLVLALSAFAPEAEDVGDA